MRARTLWIALGAIAVAGVGAVYAFGPAGWLRPYGAEDAKRDWRAIFPLTHDAMAASFPEDYELIVKYILFDVQKNGVANAIGGEYFDGMTSFGEGKRQQLVSAPEPLLRRTLDDEIALRVDGLMQFRTRCQDHITTEQREGGPDRKWTLVSESLDRVQADYVELIAAGDGLEHRDAAGELDWGLVRARLSREGDPIEVGLSIFPFRSCEVQVDLLKAVHTIEGEAGSRLAGSIIANLAGFRR